MDTSFSMFVKQFCSKRKKWGKKQRQQGTLWIIARQKRVDYRKFEERQTAKRNNLKELTPNRILSKKSPNCISSFAAKLNRRKNKTRPNTTNARKLTHNKLGKRTKTHQDRAHPRRTKTRFNHSLGWINAHEVRKAILLTQHGDPPLYAQERTIAP